MRSGWTYIMTNRPRGVLYIGVTASLPGRVWQHRNGKGSAFCRRYKLTRPPEGFNGYEDGCYGDADYSRQCTPEERELLDRRFPDAFTDEAEEQRKADEAERDAYFAELAEARGSSLAEGWGGGPCSEDGMVRGPALRIDPSTAFGGPPPHRFAVGRSNYRLP